MGGTAHRRARTARGVGTIAMALMLHATVSLASPTPAASERATALASVAPGLDPTVLAWALEAADCATRRGLIPSPGVLTVIDYSRPSNERRLWVLDLEHRRLLYRELVAHGRGSGELHATLFSNEVGSMQSSLGLFVTTDAYAGQHGRSLRMQGLEPGINDHARERDLVMHGADYVSPEFAARQGRLGRSLGCPALPLAVASAVIDVIRGGTAIFAYYPDPTWLETSRFLGSCAVAPMQVPVRIRATPGID
jgi:L,D-transpeptidase catalytic domain